MIILSPETQHLSLHSGGSSTERMMKKFTPVALLWLCLLLTNQQTPARASAAQIETCHLERYRLPERIRPIHYDLFLYPPLEGDQFTGSVDIQFEVIEYEDEQFPKNKLVLNVNAEHLHLMAERIKLNVADSRQPNLKVIDLCQDEDNELLWLTFNESLEAGLRGAIHFEFAGNFRTDFQGLYKSELEVGGAKSLASEARTFRFISTQFESTDARSVFPCFDEPKFRATTKLTLLAPRGWTVLANTDPESSSAIPVSKADLARKQSGLQLNRVTFQTTPAMPVYLLAFAIGELEFIERHALGNRLRVRVYAPLGMTEHGRVALEVACQALELMQRQLSSVPYPGSKVDFVPIPQFKAGAMENLGLILMDKSLVLSNYQDSTLEYRFDQVAVILHELVHQWLGNAVSLNWWSDLWLKEGFAEFLAYHYANQLYPSFGFLPERLLAHAQWPYLASDAGLGDTPPQPVRGRPLTNSKEVEDIFDDITYGKGALIVRMIHRHLGEDLFRLALNDFVGNHANGNVSTTDFIQSVQQYSSMGPSFGDYLNTWLQMPNYPVLMVDYDASANQLIVKQRPVNEDPSQEASRLWYVASEVLVASEQAEEEVRIHFVMTNKEREVLVPLPSWFRLREPTGYEYDHWVKVSPDSVGVFRVRYSPRLFKQLEFALVDKRLSVADRLNLIDDLFSLEDTDSDEMTKFVGWFKDETNAIVLDKLLKHVYGSLQKTTSMRNVDQLIEVVTTIEHYFARSGHLANERTSERLRNNLDVYKPQTFASGDEPKLLELEAIGSILSKLVELRHATTIERLAAQLKSGTGLQPLHLRQPICSAILQERNSTSLAGLLSTASQSLDYEERRSLSNFLAWRLTKLEPNLEASMQVLKWTYENERVGNTGDLMLKLKRLVG